MNIGHLYSSRRVMLATVALLAAAGCSTNTPTTPVTDGPKGWLYGTIIGALSTPLQGVTITTEPATDTVATDVNGGFTLDGIPTGVYTVRASKNGSSTFAYFTVIANDTAQAKMRLALWKPLWSDEFTDPMLNTALWKADDQQSGLPEMRQYFSPDDVILDSGLLRLRIQERERGGLPYTTGQLTGQVGQKYGRFEVRARLPYGKGLWTAHWLWNFPTTGYWQEIDIMEMLGKQPGNVYLSYHFTNDQGALAKQSRMHIGPDFSQDFHVFAVEWYPDEIKWFIDSAEQFRASTVGEQEPLRMILSTYVGGNWPGYPDSTTVFPQYHDIDYVRVYVAAP